jgi:hypothetical protein
LDTISVVAEMPRWPFIFRFGTFFVVFCPAACYHVHSGNKATAKGDHIMNAEFLRDCLIGAIISLMAFVGGAATIWSMLH